MLTYIAVSIAAAMLAFIWCMLFAWTKVKPHDTGCLGILCVTIPLLNFFTVCPLATLAWVINR